MSGAVGEADAPAECHMEGRARTGGRARMMMAATERFLSHRILLHGEERACGAQLVSPEALG